jgi:hypothetical protein
VSLNEARVKRDDGRKQPGKGVDPADQKRHNKHTAKVGAANAFAAVARA